MFARATQRAAITVSSCDDRVARVLVSSPRVALTQLLGDPAVRPLVGRDSPACDAAVSEGSAGAEGIVW